MMAAPNATTSSGLMFLLAFLPSKKDSSIDWIFGMRVEPPTMTISSMEDLERWASERTWVIGSRVLRNYNR